MHHLITYIGRDGLELFRPRTARHLAQHAMPDGVGPVFVTDVEIRLLMLGAFVVQQRVELQERSKIGSKRALDAFLKLDHTPPPGAVIKAPLDCRVDWMYLEIGPAQRFVVTSADGFPTVPFRADRYLAHR